MIKNLLLKFGKGPGSPIENIPTTPVTVFVGPNNSGKSKILDEINQFCSSGHKNNASLILENIEFDNLEFVEEKIRKVTLKPNKRETLNPEHLIVGKKNTRLQVPIGPLIEALNNPNSKKPQFCQFYLSYNILKLDGKNRIDLVNQQAFGDLQQLPQSSFQVLFRENELREEVRRIIKEAFDYFFVIDPGQGSHLRIRLSPTPPTTEEEERGWHNEAIKFHSNALPIDQTSDGVKAFTGMITEIIAGDPLILLIDEPEAFLHPALSYKLGNEIARASLKSEKRLFVSTHSANFVMGCIQSGASVNIVRLTYRENVATARLLPNDEILRLMRNPLLRSTGVLNGLFYEFVIVTEADADRAFYQEINERLQRYKQEWGIPNCLFLNAQNKQTIQTIIKPLRDLGIPAAGIVDIDILKEGGSVWSSFLKSAFVPGIHCKSLATSREAVKKRFEEIGKDMVRDGGIQLLQGADREAAEILLENLAEYGLFVVPNGELESWLKHLNVNGKTPNWLIEVFQKMGEDPEETDYLKPADNDVWKFLGKIKLWLTDSNRKGIPT